MENNSTHTKLQLTFFFLLFLSVTTLTFFVFKPFLVVLALAAIFAVILHPIYDYFLKSLKGRRAISASIVILLVIVFIVGPLIFFGTVLFQEAGGLYGVLQGNETNYVENVTVFIEKPIQKLVPNFSIDVQTYAGTIINWIVGNVGAVVSGTAALFINLFLIIFSLFFFLQDGHKFRDRLVELSPLEDVYDYEIVDALKNTINSVVRGALLIALIQGFLVGIGLFVFGVPNSTLWGSVAALAALVPGLGTALVVGPAVIYLFLVNKIVAAVGLIIWGIVVVGLVDNLLAPFFYSQGVKVHQLFVLFAVLGGLALFGPVGFIFGPIILSLFIALIDIYKRLFVGEGI